MDKYEFRVSMDEIDRLISERRFDEAAVVADTIDWTRVKGVRTLCKISDLYKINKRYVDARDLMAIAYERNPSGRKIIYSLCELELKLNNYIHALQLYNAFINVAPRDSDRYLLQYKLYKKQDVNIFEQILVLEEFLQHDFRERWAYELAVLYQRAGDEQRCIRQCDEIVAYFGDGRFVIRALELKKSLTQLTPEQEERLAILKSGGKIEPPAPEPEEGAQAQAADSDTAGGQAQTSVTEPDAAEAETGADREEEEKTGADTESGIAKKASGADEAEEEAAEDTSESEPEQESAEPAVPEAAEPASTTEEYTDSLLRDVKMQETIARGMQEIGDYDSVLAQETSGQFAMVMEEDQQVESQVEGQLDLAQIMSEWEKIRRDSEQQRLAEARKRVLERSDEAKRQLYGDTFTGDPDTEDVAANKETDAEEGSGASGSTRSWKKEDVEKEARKRKRH